MNSFDKQNHFTEQYNQPLQSGSGFFDNVYAKALNMIPSSDNTGTKVFPGERHAPLKLKNGRMGIANFVGPGTQVLKRLRRGDSGRTPVDDVAKMHDINYTLAQNSKNKKEQIQKIRNADNRMLKSLDKITRDKTDAWQNVKVGKLIAVKTKLEDIGIMSKGSFGGPLENLVEGDLKTLNSAKDELIQDGYGLPGSDLKKQLMKKYGKVKKAKKAKKQKGGSVDVVANVLPFLAKNLGINSITTESIKKLLKPLIKKDDDIVNKIKKISKAVLPILVSHKLKTHDVKPTAKKVKELLKGNTQKLLKDLTGVITQIIKQQSGKGKFKGSGFWQDFSKGFMMVMRPALPVLATVATALGQPEFAIPLTIASALINK